MGTIASLLAQMNPTIRPWAQGQREVAEARLAETAGETSLRQLAELKRKQHAEALLMERIQNDPELRQRLFGESIIGSLGTAPGGPPPAAGPGPITQSPLGGGAAQPIPAPPDASRFAGVPPQSGGPIPPGVMGQTMPTVTPPQGPPGGSVLGSLGPAGGMPGAPQGPMQAPQNPLLEMARRDPRAALMLQQQLEGRQDAALKRQEQNLKLGAATLGYVGQQAQGVTDQAGLDAMRSDLQSQGLGKYAAQLPQMYSKEAMQPFIAKALDVKESLTLQVQDLTAQAAVIKARKEGRSVDVDNQLRAMGVQPGQETPAQINEALQAVEDAKVRVSAAHGSGQIVQTPGGAARIGKDNQVEYLKGPQGEPIYPKPTAEEQRAASYGDRAKAAHDTAVTLEEKGLTPGIWSKVGEALPFGLGNYLVGEDQQRYRQTVNQFAQAILRKESGAAISPTEYTMTERTYFPQPGDSKKVIDQKRQERERVIQSMQEEGKQTGRTGTQPQGPGAPAAPPKPVSQLNAEETRAEIAAIKARGGR